MSLGALLGARVRYPESAFAWRVTAVYRGACALGDLAQLESLESSTIHYEPVANLERLPDVTPALEHTFEWEKAAA